MKHLVSAAAASVMLAAAAFAGAPEVPAGTKPLTAAEILALLDGKTFEFVAYDIPVTGTSSWDSNTHSVSGSYVWNNFKTGTYKAAWSFDGDKSCTQVSGRSKECQTVYAYEGGFLEVNAKGKVHAVSKPVP